MNNYVNVCIGETCLKTVIMHESERYTGEVFIENLYSFPDSDRLYLEDINGYRYKRICRGNGNRIMFFKQI